MRNLFWEYSLATYRRRGVAEHCLRAQNALGIDINFLLYASWLASIDQRLDFSHLRGLDANVGQWREEVVVPLRNLRQHWRSLPAAAELRTELQAIELRAEQNQQDMMWRYYLLAPPLQSRPRPLQENLVLTFESQGCDRERWMAVVPYLLSALRAARA